MRWTNYILLLGIGLIWGSQFFFVKIVIDNIQPLTLAAYKALFGAATLGVLSFFVKNRSSQNKSNPFNKRWLIYLWIALLEAVIPFFLIGWGQQRITSSLTAILMGTVPIFTILLAAVFVKKEKINALKWISVIFGFIGILLLIAPDISFKAINLNVLGILAVLGAALSFAGSLILLNRLPSISPIIAMRNVLSIAAVLLIPLAFIFENPMEVNLRSQQWIALIILGVFHAGIVYMLYNILINRTGAIFTSLNNYLVPLFGVILGTLFLNEHLSLMDNVSLFIIFISLGIGGINLRKGNST
ncbi:membrane protein [Paenibacillus baekrokdamisoli]|uniref:Membrane protein n=1 Tax=Paenibacillus baekrokdamisoli TaxID=1712516 RepID=A0A3G9IXI6_9BACL|nr:DMT family transporter [Paenibacillus baekrokdamisoli]MBB3068758.1 drug/metabolite transporter (DMT)-like permease [Paenibacillus baekrokdamisoli]BBH23590.1 membrane protein [Paenibacillus baekrokdamisoli]